MRNVTRAGGAVTALMIAVALVAAPAAADPEWRAQQPARSEARLTLSISPSGPSLGSAPGADSVTLTCDPDDGSHPTSGQACDSLRAVDGHFSKLPPVDGMFCILVYDPVRVEARGNWGDREVQYSEVFSNRCFAAVNTDNVFNF